MSSHHATYTSSVPDRLTSPYSPRAQRLPLWCNGKFMQSLCSVNQARQYEPPVWNVSTLEPNQSRLGWHKCNSSRKQEKEGSRHLGSTTPAKASERAEQARAPLALQDKKQEHGVRTDGIFTAHFTGK